MGKVVMTLGQSQLVGQGSRTSQALPARHALRLEPQSDIVEQAPPGSRRGS